MTCSSPTTISALAINLAINHDNKSKHYFYTTSHTYNITFPGFICAHKCLNQKVVACPPAPHYILGIAPQPMNC